MTTTGTHINPAGLRLLGALSVAILAALLPPAALGYGWPVKPFDRQHPVRGYFGDPRTLFHQGPTRVSLYHGDGSFSFHQGVDVCAPDHTPVYPVESGVVDAVTPEWIRVRSGRDAFEYWHIAASVRVGQRVEMQHTVLGRIKHGAKHVHLTEVRNGVVVNPLLGGHLEPYSDRTKPWIASIHLRTSDEDADLMPGFVRGSIELLAEAYDPPALPAPGEWQGLPVTPALVTWRVERWDGKVVVPERVARDVRAGVPRNTAFWTTYARGSYQNMSVFGKHYSWGQPGSYVFRLMPGMFDTRQLRDGLYQLVVTVGDTSGNRSSSTQRIAVHNAPGEIGV